MGHIIENQGGQLSPSTEYQDSKNACEQGPTPMININNTIDQLPSHPTENVPYSGQCGWKPPLTSSMAGATPQVYHIPNPDCSNILPSQVPIDPMPRMFKYGSSSSTMAANPENIYLSYPQEILNYVNKVDQDMNAILNHHVMLFHSTINASLEMHRKSLFQMLKQAKINLLQEKNAEEISAQAVVRKASEQDEAMMDGKKMTDGTLILANEVRGSPQVGAVAAVAENAVVPD